MKRTALLLSIGIAAVLLLALVAFRRPTQEPDRIPEAQEICASEADADLEEYGPTVESSHASDRQAVERTALPLAPLVGVEGVGTTVRITVRADRDKESPVVPGVRVVIGIGQGLVDWRGFRLKGVRVLGEGQSDEEGSLELTIDVPRVDAEGDRLHGYLFFAHVDEPGYQKQPAGCAIPDPAESSGSAPIELLVAAQRGLTLFGSVLLVSGEPASDGRVQVFREKENGKRDYSQDIMAFISREGRFKAHLPEAGLWHVHARCKNLGAFGVRDFEVVDGISEKLVLQLEGTGVLAGRVVDLAGQPIPAYKLWAVPGDRPDDYVGHYYDPVCLPHEWSGGTFDGHTTTNEDGEFRFAGLQEGAYFIRGTQAGSRYYDAKLTLAPVATGRTDLELSLPRHCVLLTVRDESGEPIRLHKMGRPEWRRLYYPYFYVKKSDGQGRVLNPFVPAKGEVGWLKSGQHAVEVLPDEHYLVGVIGLQHSLQETEVRVPFGEFGVPVEIDLTPAAEPGIIRIEVQSSKGEPLTSDTRVELRSPSGLVLFKSDRMSFSSTHELKLPSGTYTCHVSEIVRRGHHGKRIGRQEHSPVVVEAHVESGRELFLPIRLAGAGRVKVLALLDSGGGEPVPDGLGIELLFYPKAGGEALQVQFDRTETAMSQSTSSWVRAGTAETCIAPLPTGKYVAHLSHKGFSTAKVPIVIKAGKTAEVQATLVRE